MRALHQTIDVPPILVDPLAKRILGPDGAVLLSEASQNAGETTRLRATLAVRSRVAEEAVGEAVARSVAQCVILGAGLDTFAYRHGHRALQVFEVDRPAMQAWKRRRLRDAKIGEPSDVRYVGADFLHEDLLGALAAAGFAPARPAVFVMLGVSFYLERDVIARLLHTVASRGMRETEIVFDYIEPFEATAGPMRAAYEAAAARVAAGGEPWKTFFEPAAIANMLREAGFTKVADLGAAALDARFCAGRVDGLKVGPLLHLVRARV